jgi:hypothetical protein
MSDRISGNRFETRRAYHHGYFDGVEREFRGFARVDQWDGEDFGVPAPPAGPARADQPRSRVASAADTHQDLVSYRRVLRRRTHLASYGSASITGSASNYREGDPAVPDSERSAAERASLLLDDTVMPPDLGAEDAMEAVRSLKARCCCGRNSRRSTTARPPDARIPSRLQKLGPRPN